MELPRNILERLRKDFDRKEARIVIGPRQVGKDDYPQKNREVLPHPENPTRIF